MLCNDAENDSLAIVWLIYIMCSAFEIAMQVLISLFKKNTDHGKIQHNNSAKQWRADSASFYVKQI